MTINQIYATINSIAQNLKLGTQNVIDYSTFVNFGNDVLSSDINREQFYNTLVDRIGKTVFAIREYEADNRNVKVDSFTFGSILQKISYSLQNAEENETWDDDASNPYTWKAKGGIHQKLFAQSMPSFSYKDVIYDHQLESAFTSPTAMAGFINGLYTRMYNALEISVEGMNSMAINSFALEIAKEVRETVTKNPRRFRNLLAEYNKTHTPIITSKDEAFESDSFFEFACVELGIVIPKIGKLTSMYNDGTVERFTDPNNLVIEMHNEFTKKFDVYLKSNTYHDELVSLPKFNGSVPYWVSESENMNIVGNDGTEGIEIPNVICIMRDTDAVVTTLEREKMRSLYDNINERTYVKLSADRRYICDTSENGIVFYLDYTPTTITFDKGEGSGTMDNTTIYDATYTLPQPTFTHDSKVFSGWSVNGSEETYDVGTVIGIDGDVTLTAIFE